VKIPKESDPDINIPIINVRVTLEGVSPEDAERLLLRPLEVELRSIEGKKEMRSNAYQGGANVVLEFEAGFNVEKALRDVRDKVDRAKPELPAEATSTAWLNATASASSISVDVAGPPKDMLMTSAPCATAWPTNDARPDRRSRRDAVAGRGHAPPVRPAVPAVSRYHAG
jgi:multidrug efflux pump subunit AcrB